MAGKSKLKSKVVQPQHQLSDADILAMRKPQLQQVLQSLNLPNSGVVPELKMRLRDALRARVDGQQSNEVQKVTGADPAEISPECYHQDLFKANFPLVDVVHESPFPVCDKFEPGVLDPGVMRMARREWIRRFLEVGCYFSSPKNSPQHLALLESIGMFTRPSSSDLDYQNRFLGKRKWTSADVEKALKRPRLHDENEGFLIVLREEDVQGSDENNNSDSSKERDARSQIPTEFMDGVVHAYDNGKVNPDKVVCVVARTFYEDRRKENAWFRGAFHAVKQAIRNLEGGHGSPVYILIMTHSTWSYGILVPEGLIQVRNGSVDFTSMANFERYQQATGISETKFGKLCEKLKLGTKFYQDCYRDNPQAVYRDGPMLVGKLYLSENWFPLPLAVAGDDLSGNSCRLFDGLMRIVLGDSVLSMSDQDLYLRARLRKLMSEQQLQSYMNGREERWRYDNIDPNMPPSHYANTNQTETHVIDK